MKTQVCRPNTDYLNLGPGTYAAEKVKIVTTVKDMNSNSFSTKVSFYFLNIDRFLAFARQLQVQALTKDPRT